MCSKIFTSHNALFLRVYVSRINGMLDFKSNGLHISQGSAACYYDRATLGVMADSRLFLAKDSAFGVTQNMSVFQK